MEQKFIVTKSQLKKLVHKAKVLTPNDLTGYINNPKLHDKIKFAIDQQLYSLLHARYAKSISEAECDKTLKLFKKKLIDIVDEIDQHAKKFEE